MKHDKAGSELGGGFQSLTGQLDRPFPFLWAVRGELVAVGVIDPNLHRHWAEIMDADDAESPLGMGFADPVQLGDTQSMAQFNRVESHTEDFGHDRSPVVMTAGIPVGREGKH